jgi:hypothetical protein
MLNGQRKVELVELNKRQKSLLIQILSKEWEKASMLVFNCSIKDIKERSSTYFSEEWRNARQNVIDIENMIDLIDDKKSKKVYFETIEKSFAIQAEKNYHKIMDNK